MLLRVRARSESQVTAGTSRSGSGGRVARRRRRQQRASAATSTTRKTRALREANGGGFGGVGWRKKRDRVRRKVRRVAETSLDTLDVLLREGLGKSFHKPTKSLEVSSAASVSSPSLLPVSAASAVVRAPASALRLFVRQLHEESALLRWARLNPSATPLPRAPPTTTPTEAASRRETRTAAAVAAPPATAPLPQTVTPRQRRAIVGSRRRRVSTMPRVFCISDVHTDHAENMSWVQGLSKDTYRNDTLLLGGDISDSREILEKTLAAFRARFKHVFFVPGNHDLWLRKGTPSTVDSYDKLHELFELCESLGVQTRPAKVDGVWIVPLLSWHHESFDTEPDIEGWKGIPSHRDAMMDFKLCRWPAQWNERDNESIVAKKLDQMNEELCSSSSSWEYTLPEDCEGVSSWEELLLACRAAREAGEPVISFSHFLPHIELLPEKRMLFFPNLAKAVGSNYLRKRVEKLAPTCHVFGHTHFAWDTTIKGTRYLQVPLAKPSERRVRMRSLAIGDIEFEPLCVWEGEKFCNLQEAHWSEFYKKNERDPYNTRELASWVERLYTKL